MDQIGIGLLAAGTKDETWGLVEDLTIGLESEKEAVKNGDGDTVGILYTDKRKKVSANYTPLAVAQGGTTPVTEDDLIGQQLEIKTFSTSTLTFLVEGAELKLKKGGACTWAVNGYYYPNVVVSAT
jgi:hypothetical protein